MIKHNFPPAPLGPAKDHDELYAMKRAMNIKHKTAFHYFDHHEFKGKLYCMFEISPKDLLENKKEEVTR